MRQAKGAMQRRTRWGCCGQACSLTQPQQPTWAIINTSAFKNSKVETVTRFGETGPGPKGSVLTVVFELDGQKFTALNGGPMFKFTEAISLGVNCENQQEIDE